MNNDSMIMMAVGVVLVVVLILAFIMKGKKNNTRTNPLGNFDVDSFLTALGGLENVLSCKATSSKISVELEDETKANAEKLKELGATGVVVTSNKVIIILGQISIALEEYITNKLSR